MLITTKVAICIWIVKKLLNHLYSHFKKQIIIYLIMAAGICARYWLRLSLDSAITTSDTSTYISGARSIYFNLLLNEYRPPVYPLCIIASGVFFSWEHLNRGIILLQIIFSLVNVVFTYKLAAMLTGNKLTGYLSALIVAVNFRVFSWDFVILTENLSILIVTMTAYYLVSYLGFEKNRDFSILIGVLLSGIFTKPFFLMLPFVIFFAIILRQIQKKAFDYKLLFRKISVAAFLILFSVFAYSYVNYAQNSFFGITTVGNVNYFGKILQYNMQHMGDNDNLKEDLEYAFKTEKPEHIVHGRYLEPWYFIGTYGWSKDHYKEIGRFSTEIIKKHPLIFIKESSKLTYSLFIYDSPFEDYIADSWIQKAGHKYPALVILRMLTEKIDSLYFFLIICLFDTLIKLIQIKRKGVDGKSFLTGVLLSIVLYHYIISAFFSYGDYCRLLVPCYPLIYIIITVYLVKISSFAYSKSILALKYISIRH